MRTILGGSILSSSLFFLLFMILSCAPKLENRVKAFEKAYNSHDLERIMSLYAENATFEAVGQFVLKGKEQIRDLTEYDIALNIHMSISECIAKGDTVICKLAETNDWFKTAGIKETYYSTKFVFSDGLIKLLRANATPETNQAFSQVLNPLTEWASKERPQQLAEMMPAGRFVYNAENAKKALALLQEWLEETNQP
ncbi:nuclear transport factor 2 family protein [candidate division WOR-3 bacterium]|nr:nuclear transport factor 2 family protein [candidate division WOR-3 bacterium]